MQAQHLRLNLVLLLFRLVLSIEIAIPSANVLVFYNSAGRLENKSEPLFLGKYWARQLSRRLTSSSNWPMNLTVEFIDSKSQLSLVSSLLNTRILNKNLPNVTAILGPFGTSNGYAASRIATKYNIPVVFQGVAAYATTNGLLISPSFLSTSFFLAPPGVQFDSPTAINAYIKVGATTIVIVYLDDVTFPSSKVACRPLVTSASLRGIRVMNHFTFSLTNNTDDLYKIVIDIKYLNPDIVVWCDITPSVFPYRVPYHPLPLFRRANYLPKALTLQDCLDSPLLSELYESGLYQFVSAGQYYNPKCGGPDYTEDFTPYSSLFRPNISLPLTV